VVIGLFCINKTLNRFEVTSVFHCGLIVAVERLGAFDDIVERKWRHQSIGRGRCATGARAHFGRNCNR
jgi:hypothetical protein